MKKRLTKVKETAVLAGVLSGLADYFDQDPLLFRLGAVFLLIITGVFPGILMYIVAAIVLPKAPPTYQHTIDS